MFNAMLNQIPDTMEVTQLVLGNMANLNSVVDSDGEINMMTLHQMMARQKAVFGYCLMLLENRMERLEGREGIPDDRLEAIMSEFFT